MTNDFNESSQPSAKDFPYSAKGRFGRLSYFAWLFITNTLYSCALLIVMIFGLIAFASNGMNVNNVQSFISSPMGIITIILLVVVIIASILLTISITIRRVHDLNKSGWLCLLSLVPIVNVFFGLYIMFAPGTKGQNKYGPVRETEQTEKIIGTLYCALLVIVILFYTAFFAVYSTFNSQLIELQQEYSLSDDIEAQPSSMPLEENNQEANESEHTQQQETPTSQRSI